MTNYALTNNDLATVHRLTVDAIESLDYQTSYEFETRSRGQLLTDAIATAQRMQAFCNDSARGAYLESDTDEWLARAWEYRLEVEALKYIEFVGSLVESADKARAKADASYRASLTK
jgi:hypothetical protein